MNKKERLNKLLTEGYGFINKGLMSDDNKFIAWKNSLIRFIEQYYGKDSTISKQFESVSYSPMLFTTNTSDDVFKKCFNDGMNETIEDLRRLIDEIDDLDEIDKEGKKSKEPYMNIKIDASNKNIISNSNVNSILIKSYDEVRDEIENNTYLDDKSIKELLEKLNEIKELENSGDSKAKKWIVGKKILAFVRDKGADIAIMYISLILQSITK